MAEPFRVLTIDSSVSEVAALRLGAAVLCVLSVVWLALSSPPWWALLLIPLGLFVVVFWVRRYQAAQRGLEGARGHIDLRPEAFHLVTQAGAEVIEWERVASVEADEDRVALRIDLHEGTEPVWVEPTYGGLGLYELEEAFRSARQASPSYGE